MPDPVCLPEDVVASCILSCLALRDARSFLCTARVHAKAARHPALRRRRAVDDIKYWFRERRVCKLDGSQVWVRIQEPEEREGASAPLPFCRPRVFHTHRTQTALATTDPFSAVTFRKGWVVRIRGGAAGSNREGGAAACRSERTGFALSPTPFIEKPVRFFDTLTRAEDFNPDYLGMGTYVDWCWWEDTVRIGTTLDELWDTSLPN